MYPLENWTGSFKKAFKRAGIIAVNSGTKFIGTEHLIYAFLCTPDSEAYKVLHQVGVTKEKYGKFFQSNVDGSYDGEGFTPRTRVLYEMAAKLAVRDGVTPSTLHMLNQILFTKCVGVDFLSNLVDISHAQRETMFALQNYREYGPSNALGEEVEEDFTFDLSPEDYSFDGGMYEKKEAERMHR